MKTGLLLASASPRRRELISRLGRDFIAVSVNADETIPKGAAAEEVPVLLAERKAEAALSLPEAAGRIIIAADTVVILDGKIYGKPSDEDDARRMLQDLSGKTHQVVTGVCVIPPYGEGICFNRSTDVTFYPICEKEIDDYIATGEPMDKAGAYGIQGAGCMLIEEIKGDFFNVVGLPVAQLGRIVEMFG